MTDEQLTAIEQRRAAAKAEVIAICKGKQWRMCIPVEQTDSDICITNSLDDIDALVAEVRRQREMLNAFYLVCVHLDKAVPVFGMTNTERIRAAADEIVRLRADIERIGRERDQMVAANVELQERLSKLEDDGK